MLLIKKTNNKSRAFNLVELLVVIVIITVLIALFVPAVSHWKMKAWMTKGSHNARQLLLGAQSYSAEHRGLPPQTDFSSKPDPAGYTRWVEEIAPYVYGSIRTNASGQTMVDGTFRCPGLKGYKQYGDRWHRWDWPEVDWMPVLYRRPQNGGYMALNMLNSANSKTPYLVSTDKNNGSSGLSEGDQAMFDLYVPPSVWIYNRGVIVGYLDGHVEIVPSPNSTNIFKK